MTGQPASVDSVAQGAASLMARALALAERGGGATAPNPMVGCVVADVSGRILGEGFHARAGEPHAEVLALDQATRQGRDPAGATVVVNLEPCAHHGRTPPCVEALRGAGVGRVVYAVEDPYVGHGGAEWLGAAGIRTEAGVGRLAATRLNEAWLHWVATGRPFFHLKVAQTLSGHVTRGRGGARWITSPTARARVHRLRRRHAAILIGVGTALADDPLLTVRDWPSRRLGAGEQDAADGTVWPAVQPLRVVLDSRLRLPLDSHLVSTVDVAPLLVFCSPDADSRPRTALERRGVEVTPIEATARGLDLGAVAIALGERGVTGVLVEPGPRLVAAFFEAGLVDRWTVFVAPDWVDSEEALRLPIPSGIRLEDIEWERFGRDAMLSGRVERAG
jgi:diaminohydroxyphosphoribosylaminopyrimidine deaminase/5-amino-6-(5-phosphoribosylamino)uracil reductase